MIQAGFPKEPYQFHEGHFDKLDAFEAFLWRMQISLTQKTQMDWKTYPIFRLRTI